MPDPIPSAISSSSVMNSTNSDSYNDPFYLHNSDGPGLVLVSQVLTGDNYATWSRSMRIALSVKNKLDFVEGTVISEPDPADPTFRAWLRNNNVVISWILNSVSKEISSSIIYLSTAAEMWKELKERFQQSNGPRIFQLKRDLMNVTQGSDSVSTYFTKLKTLWEELSHYNTHCTCGKCTCGGAKEAEHAMSFLMGLNSNYAQVRGQILLMDPIPSVNKIFSLIIQEERQTNIGNSSTPTLAFNTRVNTSSNINHNSNNMSNNNKPKSNPPYKSFRKDSPFCMHCNKTGHTQEKCYRLHGFPPGYRNSNSSSPQPRVNSVDVDQNSVNQETFSSNPNSNTDVLTGLTQQQCEGLIALLSGKIASANMVTHSTSSFENLAGKYRILSFNSGEYVSNVWILDSGATRHICNNKSVFTNMRGIIGTRVKLPNHNLISVTYQGDIRLTNDILLTDVLYVPQFELNLISVTCLTKSQLLMVKLYHNHAVIKQITSKKMIGRADVHEGLYLLDIPSQTFSTNAAVTLQQWHSRFGHPANDKIKILGEELSLSNKDCEDLVCSVCPLAKQKRIPFVSMNHIANKPFDILHCDVWGPYQTPSFQGHKYFVTLVDDCTRFCWIYMMKHKSDVQTIIPRFLVMVSTQFNGIVKVFRSDNAKELLFTDLFQSKGILHQFSCVERPQQNSVVERKHQHILNVARALYFQSNIPIEYWSECVLTAVFLINRTPSKVLNHSTPYQKMYNEAPAYHSFRSFGCLAFASTLVANRTKFDPRAKACVFIGYPPGMKAYKLLDLVTHEVLISRDVVFHENVFPFLNSTPNFEKDPFALLVLPKSLDVIHDNSQPHISSNSILTSIPATTDSIPISSNSVPISVTDDFVSNSTNSVPLRQSKSGRIIKKPSYLKDFHCNLLTTSTKCRYPLSDVLSYDQLSPTYRAFTVSLSSQVEPRNYHEAAKCSEWQQAMDEELTALELNNT